ncbi:MAG: YggT family protein [Gammaproteobacteria bacterium]|nr:YggT family protein [Gammaproteobacteria bacterium]
MTLLIQVAVYLFKAYAMVVLLRFFMQYFRVDFYNPFSQTIVQLTNPPLKPLRRLIPGFRGLDIASLLLAFVLSLLMLCLVYGSLVAQNSSYLLPLSAIAVLEFAYLIFDLFWYLIVARIIVSFIMMAAGNNQGNPFAAILFQLTRPIMQPFQRVIPPVGMFDFSPIIIFLLIGIIQYGLQILALEILPVARLF